MTSGPFTRLQPLKHGGKAPISSAAIAIASSLGPKGYPLNQSPFYKLKSRQRLAALLFSSLANLERLANQDDNYRSFTLVHAGKSRAIELPKPSLARIHRRIFDLLDDIEKPDYLHSGRKQRSYITNAQVHVGAVPLLKLDIKQFYKNISSARIFRFFHRVLECSPDVASMLAKLCTSDGHLPIGSCVSQLLAFFSAKSMFDDLHQHSREHGVRDSYYVDDLTWSGAKATPSFLWVAKRIVCRHGFKYHGDRAYTSDQDKVVTGVLISGDRIAVQRNRELWKSIKALDWYDDETALKAIKSLIGKSQSNAQIDERFARRTRMLLVRKREMDQKNQSGSKAGA